MFKTEFYFAAEIFIARTATTQVSRTMGGQLFQSLREDSLDLLPAFGSHGARAPFVRVRCNQTRAVAHSRLAVA